MSENAADAESVNEHPETPETDMTDPDNYGSLTIEDPDGDDDDPNSDDEGKSAAPEL